MNLINSNSKFHHFAPFQRMSMMLCGFGWRKASHMNAQSALSISRYVAVFCWHNLLFLVWTFSEQDTKSCIASMFLSFGTNFISAAWGYWERRKPWRTWWWRWPPPPLRSKRGHVYWWNSGPVPIIFVAEILWSCEKHQLFCVPIEFNTHANQFAVLSCHDWEIRAAEGPGNIVFLFFLGNCRTRIMWFIKQTVTPLSFSTRLSSSQ